MTTKYILERHEKEIPQLEQLKNSLHDLTSSSDIKPQLWGCTSCSPSDSIIFLTNFGREIEDNELFCPICGANTTYDIRGLLFSEVVK